MSLSARMAAARRVVIKVGSAQLIDPASLAPREDRFDALADDIARLRQAGQDVVLVSSAAVALGRPRLGLKPGQTLTLEEKQAAAA
ncbi:MAG TPA: glutamate 5-kinase, partial [Oceanicaulis sp.]|nr:glutamate 5-kinase [Oceanicaulis sp.]